MAKAPSGVAISWKRGLRTSKPVSATVPKRPWKARFAIEGKWPGQGSIYIGTENTYTIQRYKRAVAKAIELREAAEVAYRQAATRAKRAASRRMSEK